MLTYKYLDLLPHVDMPDGFGSMAIVGKNPARFDAGNRTLLRVTGLAQRLQLTATVFNLFGARGTPAELAALLRTSYVAAVGPHNDFELLEVKDHDLVVAAWGQPSGGNRTLYDQRIDEVMELIGRDRFVCLGTTADGYPLHPIRWPREPSIIDYVPSRRRAGP